MDVFSKAKRSWVMGRIRAVNTAPERTVRSLLRKRGLRFSVYRKDLPGSPDIVLPHFKTVIQVQGCFWHGHSCVDGRRPKSNRSYWNAKLERNKRRDARNARQLRQLGWKRIVVWGCEIQRPDRLQKRLARLIRG